MPDPQAAPIVSSADSAKRSARTGIQGGISAVLLVQGWNLFAPNPLTAEQSAWLIAAGSAVPALVAYLMNMIEEASGHALFKGKSEDTTQRMLITLAGEVGRLADAMEARGLVEPPAVDDTLPARSLPWAGSAGRGSERIDR